MLEIEGWTARLLTPFSTAGIMDHEEARRKNVGGKVLGFVMLTRMKTLVLLFVGSFFPVGERGKNIVEKPIVLSFNICSLPCLQVGKPIILSFNISFAYEGGRLFLIAN
ncbi:hypothetical protein H5410_023300 [Solanum commersonii]|uniref:Uncharacterized protein n=1 Tax=Solanum commersonii TaxID=4109 RepID=A0A9J5ZGG1_SOLCO|nr:hypothetical protein H5410_023300 [Solanum commersonii]